MDSERDLKASLIKLGHDQPALRDHLRPILTKIQTREDKVARGGSLASYHSKFVSEVDHALIPLLRGTSIMHDLVNIQLDISIIGRVATIIYQYGRTTPSELNFYPTSSAQLVATKLAQRLVEGN